MIIYPDTSFLYSLYIRDANSLSAISCMKSWKGALPLTPLLQLELRNSIRLSVFRKLILAETSRLALQEIESDLRNDFLCLVLLPWTDLLQKAEEVSATYTEPLGNRGIDILHVASASLLGAEKFVTFDKRQGTLAKSVGLKVGP